MAKRVKSKKVNFVDNTPYYTEADEKDQQVFLLNEAFTFGIEERDNNPYFPYVISLSLRNDPETLSTLKNLKKKYQITEKVLYGNQEDLIYISLMNITPKQRETLYKQRCFVKAKVEFSQITTKGDNVYMNLKLVSVKKVKDIAEPTADDYSSDSE